MINKIKLLPIILATIGLGVATFAFADPKHANKATAEKMDIQNDKEIEIITPLEKLRGEGVTELSYGLVLPKLDPVRGKELFASKGCVMCHSVNGVGSDEATAFDASLMNEKMNPFDFAAKMWKLAPVMAMLQENELGGQVLFSGDELLDIIAFVHSKETQETFSEDDLSEEMKEMMKAHAGG